MPGNYLFNLTQKTLVAGICRCMYMHVYIWVCIYIYTYIYIYITAYVFMYARVCSIIYLMCMYLYMYVHKSLPTRVSVCDISATLPLCFCNDNGSLISWMFNNIPNFHPLNHYTDFKTICEMKPALLHIYTSRLCYAILSPTCTTAAVYNTSI